MDREGTLDGYMVVVSKGRIVEMGPSASVDPPADATVIDASGKYLMPGLAEMHGHMPGGDLEEKVMFLYVANGVTTVRGMLGQDGHLALRARANAGEIVAPTLYMAGPSFNDGSVNSTEGAEERVRRQKREGWDLLKIHPGPTREEYDAMAVTAQEVGIRFGGHVPADVGLEHAILMGQETFDHLDGYIEYLDAFEGEVDENRLQRIVQLTRDARAWVVPTMVLWEVGIIGRGDAGRIEAPSRDALLASAGSRDLGEPAAGGRVPNQPRAGGGLGGQPQPGAEGVVGWRRRHPHGHRLAADLQRAGVLDSSRDAGDGRCGHVGVRDSRQRDAQRGRPTSSGSTASERWQSAGARTCFC